MPTPVHSYDPRIALAVRSLVERDGVRPTGKRLQLADATVAKLAAGLPCTRGVAALARTRLRELDLLIEVTA